MKNKMSYNKDIFDEGYGYEKQGDLASAIECYNSAAKEGDCRAECRLGLAYRFGRGVPRDSEKALYWFRRSANKGNSLAMSNIGSMYRFGQGVERDYDEAFKWYTASAKLNEQYAQQNLGSMYRFGEGRAKDTEKAFYWYSKAAEQGNMYSQCNLGSMYRLGDGVERDYEKAFYWYSLAADQGYAYAKYELGVLYYRGLGVEQNFKLAFALLKEYEDDEILDFEKNGEAFYYLGQCYHNCRGVDYDITDESTMAERLRLAKEYYVKALEHKFNCKLAYEMVKRDLGERDRGGITREYAMTLLKSGVDRQELFEMIELDMKKEFGSSWDKLMESAQKALISGMFYYVSNMRCGEEVCSYIDFTNVVATLAKALEIELAEFFGKQYIEFLRDVKKIPPEQFHPDKHRFVTVAPWKAKTYSYKDEKSGQTYHVKKSGDGIEYCDERNNYGFSLGALYYVIGVDTVPMSDAAILEQKAYRGIKKSKKGANFLRVIDSNMREYSKILFREDAFQYVDFEEGAVNYLIDLAEDVRYLKELRNAADHAVIVNASHAEFCGDVLIKVYRIISDFIEKISPECIKKSLETSQRTLSDK